ncbi:MAG: TerB family tellurite resistance protein [Lachnospiraceae bacterium]|nr:TerB family tellurite resistance protein [Lachnospiraceae bacterium]
MLLNVLNQNCREDVMDLAIYVAMANDVLEATEEESLNQYYQELGIEPRGTQTRCELDACIENIVKSTSLRERKMIMLEMVALAYVDNVCDEKEQELLDKICNRFEISESMMEELVGCVAKLRNVYLEIANVIGKDE